MRNKYLISSILTVSFFVCGYVSFAQNLSTTSKKEMVSLEISHFLKLDSNGQLEKWHIGNLQHHPEYLLKIYDRRGLLVFQSKNYENNWPTAQYAENRFLFVLEIEDKRINGWVDIEK